MDGQEFLLEEIKDMNHSPQTLAKTVLDYILSKGKSLRYCRAFLIAFEKRLEFEDEIRRPIVLPGEAEDDG